MQPTVGVISLGCAKNLVDSEIALGLLARAGCRITPEPGEAGVLIINTCAFIEDAKKESIKTILETARYKENGMCRVLLVMGCLAQRYHREILAEMPEVDGVIGTGAVPEIAGLVKRALQGERILAVNSPAVYDPAGLPRLLATPPHTAYLKIAEGCSHACSFCVIPRIRGPYRSRPEDDLLREASSLIERGVKEIILIAQDTTAYGYDLYGSYRLGNLMQGLDQLAPPWLRLLYAHPARVTPELINTLAGLKHFCRYLDLPLQHAHDDILRRMRRQTTHRETVELIAGLRAAIPEIVIRTTFLVGFPGETEDSFQVLLDFMRALEFERAGVFMYSPEEDTRAYAMPDQVPERVKKNRFHRAMRVQKEISRRYNQKRIGQTVRALVEEADRENNICCGRTEADAPGVDGHVYFAPAAEIRPGDFREVLVKEAFDYDLRGEDVTREST